MQKILPLGPDAFALWDIHNAWRAEPSRVHMWVSPDSARGEAVELENHRIARSQNFRNSARQNSNAEEPCYGNLYPGFSSQR